MRLLTLASLLLLPLGSVTAQCGGTQVASHSVYNGSNVNAVALSSLNEPILGQAWNLGIDHATFMTGAILDFYVIALAPGSTNYPGFGEALIDPTFNLTFWGTPGTPLGFTLPTDPSLCGAHLYAQGAAFDGATIQLTNGIDGLLGDV